VTLTRRSSASQESFRSAKADERPLRLTKAADGLEPDSTEQERVVAHLRVAVERKMRGVDGDLVTDERRNPAKIPAYQRPAGVPEEAVVCQQEVYVSPARLLYGSDAGVHSRRDP